MRRNDFKIGTKEKALAAVMAGNKQEAIKYIEELRVEFKPLHDRLCEWLQSTLCFISERLGEEADEEAPERAFDDVYKPRRVGARMARVLKRMVARDGVEPPTPAFSGLRSTT